MPTLNSNRSYSSLIDIREQEHHFQFAMNFQRSETSLGASLQTKLNLNGSKTANLCPRILNNWNASRKRKPTSTSPNGTRPRDNDRSCFKTSVVVLRIAFLYKCLPECTKYQKRSSVWAKCATQRWIFYPLKWNRRIVIPENKYKIIAQTHSSRRDKT